MKKISEIDRVLFTDKSYQEFHDYHENLLSGIDQPFLVSVPLDLPWDGLQNNESRFLVAEYDMTAVDEKAFHLYGDNGLGRFVVVYAGIAYLLSKYAGQSEVLISTPLLCSSDQDEVYTDTVLTRIDVPGGKTVHDLIISAGNALRDAYRYQNYPRTLVDAYARFEGRFTNVMVCDEEVHEDLDGFESYDLVFVLEKGGRRMKIVYRNTTFKERVIDQLATCLNNVWAHLGKLDLPLGRISYLPEEDILKMGRQLNANTESFEFDNIVMLFEKQVFRYGARTAVTYDGIEYSYRYINEQANRLARYLKEQYAQEESPFIGLLMDRSQLSVIAMLAVLKAGRAYVPIDPKNPLQRIESIFKDASLNVLIIDSGQMNAVENFAGAIFVMDLQLNDLTEAVGDLDVKPEGADLAYLIYTSGTTGGPKGVMVEHRQMANTLQWRTAFYDLKPENVSLQNFTLAFDGAVTDIYSALLSGGTLVIPREEMATDPLHLSKLIDHYAVTHIIMTPSLYSLLLSGDTKASASLLAVTLAGEAFDRALVDKHFETFPHTRLYNEYGPTENAVCSTVCELQPDDSLISIGKPIANVKIFITDDELNKVPVGVTGEICLSGAGVTRGYLNREVLTREKYVDNPYESDGDSKLYRTGDVGRLLFDGFIVLAGRKDDQVKINGYRVELREIENSMACYSDVERVFVTARSSTPNVKFLVAYYTAVRELDEQELRSFLEQKLPAYMIPSYFVRLEFFPLTVSGKIAVNELPSHDAGFAGARQYQPAGTDLQRQLISIWEGVLGRETIGIDDNFFEIGGHSLHATQVVLRIYKELNVKLEVRSMFKNATVRKLSEEIESVHWLNAAGENKDLDREQITL